MPWTEVNGQGLVGMGGMLAGELEHAGFTDGVFMKAASISGQRLHAYDRLDLCTDNYLAAYTDPDIPIQSTTPWLPCMYRNNLIRW